ncbi:MAG: hypothetical protein JKX81_16165, partial [Arenicella sp.]|nr:hypothetical protein [Arenicella sp.]
GQKFVIKAMDILSSQWSLERFSGSTGGIHGVDSHASGDGLGVCDCAIHDNVGSIRNTPFY